MPDVHVPPFRRKSDSEAGFQQWSRYETPAQQPPVEATRCIRDTSKPIPKGQEIRPVQQDVPCAHPNKAEERSFGICQEIFQIGPFDAIDPGLHRLIDASDASGQVEADRSIHRDVIRLLSGHRNLSGGADCALCQT